MDIDEGAHPDRRSAMTTPGQKPANALQRGLLCSDMPLWMMLGLVALGLPRTVLTDLGVLEAEGSVLYYVVALVPYAVWLLVAVMRRTRTPMRDHIFTGILYGLSLVVIHELLWNVESSQGHNPPQAALDLARGFASPIAEVVVHGYEFTIAMMIGVGSGIVIAVIAYVATRIRAVCSSQSGRGRQVSPD